MIGQILTFGSESYSIEGKIGGGSYSEVFCIKNNKTEKKVVRIQWLLGIKNWKKMAAL